MWIKCNLYVYSFIVEYNVWYVFLVADLKSSIFMWFDYIDQAATHLEIAELHLMYAEKQDSLWKERLLVCLMV